MKLTVLQENLHHALQDIQKFIPSRPSLPILGSVLLTANSDGQLMLSATDLNIGIQAMAPATVTEPGQCAIPAKAFAEFISSLSAGTLDLTVVDQTVSVNGSGSKATFQSFPASDYPAFPAAEGQPVKIPTDVFLAAVQGVSFAASLDEARPVLTAVLLKMGEQFELVATDGFRLAVSVLPFSSPPLQLLIPSKGLQEVVRIVSRKKNESVDFIVSEKLKQIFFSVDGVQILVRLMEGDFPPYQKILPEKLATQIEFSAEDFIQKLKTAVIFARDSSGIIRFQIDTENQQLKLVSASSAVGAQESIIPIQVLAGESQEIAFNIKYLTDFLAITKPERLWFGMNESLKAALFRPADKPDYKYVVMPFRVNQ